MRCAFCMVSGRPGRPSSGAGIAPIVGATPMYMVSQTTRPNRAHQHRREREQREGQPEQGAPAAPKARCPRSVTLSSV
jgi:hypothetical protein